MKIKQNNNTDPNKDSLGFNYYIKQLHQISIEQKSFNIESNSDEENENDQLDFIAKLLRLLHNEGEAFLDVFIADAKSNLGADPDKTYPALLRMQDAGLIAINEGKVMLTSSGNELMEEM